jgi:hypothetical protein
VFGSLHKLGYVECLREFSDTFGEMADDIESEADAD